MADAQRDEIREEFHFVWEEFHRESRRQLVDMHTIDLAQRNASFIAGPMLTVFAFYVLETSFRVSDWSDPWRFLALTACLIPMSLFYGFLRSQVLKANESADEAREGAEDQNRCIRSLPYSSFWWRLAR